MKTFKLIVKGILLIIGVFASIYVMIWWGLIEPIINIIDAFQGGYLTGKFVGWELLKIALREVIGFVIICITCIVGIFFNSNND